MSGVLAATVGLLAGGTGGGPTPTPVDTETMTVGWFTFKGMVSTGFSTSTGLGAISDGKFAPKGNADITDIIWQSVTQSVTFGLAGVHSNSGWDTMVVGDRAFSRADADFDNATAGKTRWAWNGQANPFGTSGTLAVEFY